MCRLNGSPLGPLFAMRPPRSLAIKTVVVRSLVLVLVTQHKPLVVVELWCSRWGTM